MPWTRTARSALFAGWFGPIGAAALFYAMMIQDETGSAALWPAISLAIGASVLAHGVSGTPSGLSHMDLWGWISVLDTLSIRPKPDQNRQNPLSPD